MAINWESDSNIVNLLVSVHYDECRNAGWPQIALNQATEIKQYSVRPRSSGVFLLDPNTEPVAFAEGGWHPRGSFQGIIDTVHWTDPNWPNLMEHGMVHLIPEVIIVFGRRPGPAGPSKSAVTIYDASEFARQRLENIRYRISTAEAKYQEDRSNLKAYFELNNILNHEGLDGYPATADLLIQTYTEWFKEMGFADYKFIKRTDSDYDDWYLGRGVGPDIILSVDGSLINIIYHERSEKFTNIHEEMGWGMEPYSSSIYYFYRGDASGFQSEGAESDTDYRRNPRYRRNIDRDLRDLERRAAGGGPDEEARLLKAREQAGQLLPEQIRVAACLRHPIALLLYPEDIGGVGDGPRPMLTAEGMVVHCAGAAQLGQAIQSKINHLLLPVMADILLTIVLQVLNDVETEYAGSHEQPDGYEFIPSVRALLGSAWELIATGISDYEEDAIALMGHLRLRAAYIGSTWPEREEIPDDRRHFCSALDRALTVANVFFEIAVGGGDVYRSMLGVKAFLREICRFDPDVIDTLEIAEAVLLL